LGYLFLVGLTTRGQERIRRSGDAGQNVKFIRKQAASASFKRLFGRNRLHAGTTGWTPPQGSHAHQIVGRHVQHKELVHLGQSSHHHLTNPANGLGPAEALLDQLAFAVGDQQPAKGTALGWIIAWIMLFAFQ
jgi:hypothetical protein